MIVYVLAPFPTPLHFSVHGRRYLPKFREYAKSVVISFRIYGVPIGLSTAWKIVAVMLGSYFTLLRLKRWQLI